MYCNQASKLDSNDIAPTNITTNDRTGNFMYRPVKYLLDPNHCGTLGKTIAFVAAVFLTLTVVGLIVVIPGVIEWNRQTEAIKQKTNQNQLDNKPAVSEWADLPRTVCFEHVEEVKEKINHHITEYNRYIAENKNYVPKYGINSITIDCISVTKYCRADTSDEPFFNYLVKKKIITKYKGTRGSHIEIFFDMEKTK